MIVILEKIDFKICFKKYYKAPNHSKSMSLAMTISILWHLLKNQVRDTNRKPLQQN